MPDIFHTFPVSASAARLFQAVSTPADLDQWWTARSVGQPALGAKYELWFGPEYDWRATVSRCEPDTAFELTITRADGHWLGTRVGFQFEAKGLAAEVRFHHTGWPADTEHYRVSSYCWAMYLRILRRYLERGELIPYEQRLEV